MTSVMTTASIYTQVTDYEFLLEGLKRYPFMLIVWALMFWLFKAARASDETINGLNNEKNAIFVAAVVST